MEHVGPLPRKTAYQRSRALPAATAPLRGRVGFLVCCYQNLAAPQATEATMRVLLANGFEVVVPRLACSGLPAKSLGDREAMMDMAAANVDVLRELKVDVLVGDVASCTAHYKSYDTCSPRSRSTPSTPSAWRSGPCWPPSCSPTPVSAPPWARCAGASPSTSRARCPSTGRPARPPASCSSEVPRLEILPLEEAAMCCGGPGMYFHENPSAARPSCSASSSTSSPAEPRCWSPRTSPASLQLRNGAARYAPGVRVMHVFEVLNESIESASRRSAVIPE